MEQLEFNLLFRWFVGLGVEERVWDATVFTKNRERLLAGEVASRFLYPRRHIPRVGRHIGLGTRRLPSIRRLRTQEFQTERRHPVPDGLLAGGQRQVATRCAVDHVQVARSEDSVL